AVADVLLRHRQHISPHAPRFVGLRDERGEAPRRVIPGPRRETERAELPVGLGQADDIRGRSGQVLLGAADAAAKAANARRPGQWWSEKIGAGAIPRGGCRRGKEWEATRGPATNAASPAPLRRSGFTGTTRERPPVQVRSMQSAFTAPSLRVRGGLCPQ